MSLPLAGVATEAERLVRRAGYAGLGAVMVIENVFPPIPSEVVLPLAGFEVSRGTLTFLGALLAATAGSLIGAWILYGLGRVGGRSAVLRLHPLLRISSDDLDRAERWFARRGAWVVLGGRLVPGARSVVSVPAGALRMGLMRFSLLTVAGSLGWNAALIAAGRTLGENWRQIEPIIAPVSTAVVAAALLASVALVVRMRRRRQPTVKP